jgi:uncharacterized protein (DUF2267 family)
MAGEYQVTGGFGYAVPGTVGPDEVEGRAEWVQLEGQGLAEQLQARLGSEVDLRKVLLAVLSPLLGVLHGEPARAIAARLPYPLARELLDADDGATKVPVGAEQYLRDVSELVQHPLSAAALYARAVLGSIRATLAPEMAAEAERRMPAELAELWRTSR